jgi:poly(3-hydroxybutyrate) depolymerase
MAMGSKRVLGIVLVILSLPALLALGAAERFPRANRDNETTVSSVATLSYLTYAPRSYDPRHPTPLVTSLHARVVGQAARHQPVEPHVDREGIIVVYPRFDGSGRGSGARTADLPSRRRAFISS